MNDALILDPKAVTAVLIGGIWNDVIRETFHLYPIKLAGDDGPTLWASGFAFKTSASSEHSYSSVIVTTSGPIESIQALRSA